MPKIKVSDAMRKRAQRNRGMSAGAGSYKHEGVTGNRGASRGRSTGSLGNGGQTQVKAKKRQKIDDIPDARIVWHKKKKRDGQNYAEGRLAKAKKSGSQLTKRKRERFQKESPDKVGEGYSKKRKMKSRIKDAGVEKMGKGMQAKKKRSAIHAQTQKTHKQAMAKKRRK